MSAILVTPRVSEKAYAQVQQNIYVFNVPVLANKQQIAEAVAEQYSVGVTSVKVVVIKGKPVRASRGKRANPGTALRTKKKKAYVTLNEGDSIKLFDEEEEKKS
jgi:large subunit ribosomal protein L23